MTEVVARLKDALQDRSRHERELRQGGIATRRSACLGFGLLLALTAAAPALAQCPDGTPPPCNRAPVPPARSIAVLTFENAARDTALDWLGDALAEDLATGLAGTPGLSVKGAGIVRNAARVAGHDPRRIGRLVSVRYVVEGSYRPIGPLVHVSARLLVLPAGDARWGRHYDRPRDSLATLPDAIARDLAAVLTPGTASRRAERRPVDPRAYEAYQRGRFFFLRGDILTARALFEEAIGRDSSSAAAWAGVAMVWGELADAAAAPLEGYARGRAAAQRALALDSTIATAYVPLAFASGALDRDCRGGEHLADRAIVLDSTLPEAWVGRALMLTCQRRAADALDAVRRAWTIDSLSSYTGIYYFWVALLVAPERAAEVFARVRPRLAPDLAQFWEGYVTLRRGDCANAERLMRAAAGTIYVGFYVPALVCLGRRAEADSLVRAVIADTAHHYVSAASVAAGLLALGDRDGALAWLERAADERSWWAMLLEGWPELAPLHGDPRYEALRRRLGLAP